MPLLLPGSSHHPPYTAVAVIIGGAAVSMGLYWYFKALNNKSDEEQRESGTTQDAGDGVSALLSPSHCTSEPAGSRPEDSAAIPSNMVAEQQSLHLPRQPVRPEIMAAAHWAHMQPPAPELPAKWSGAASNGPQEEELLQVVQPR
eukprot:jgi/Tetstr1/438432/TSEL_026989.t1